MAQRLLIAGFPKVFEIGRIFRNEGQSREHLQDYTAGDIRGIQRHEKNGIRTRSLPQDREGSVRKTQFEINGHSVDFTPNGLK